MNRFTTHMLTYNGEFDKYAANEFGQNWVLKPFITKPKEGANKRGNSSRLTQSFHFFMFEPIFSPVNALNQPI